MRWIGTTTTVTALIPWPITRSPAALSGGRCASRGAGAWSAATIISLDGQRRPTDTCDQDRQGPLGFHPDRRRRTAARGHPWGLVVVASALGPLTCGPPAPERTHHRLHARGDACRQPGRAGWQKRLGFVQDPWSHGAPGDPGVAP